MRQLVTRRDARANTDRRVAHGNDQLKAELATRPDLVGRIIDDVRSALLEEEQTNPLSPREREVLRLVGQGKKNTEIAALLEISGQTVKNHMTAILHKLGVPNRTRAVTYAVRQGWLVLGEPSETEAETSETTP